MTDTDLQKCYRCRIFPRMFSVNDEIMTIERFSTRQEPLLFKVALDCLTYV